MVIDEKHMSLHSEDNLNIAIDLSKYPRTKNALKNMNLTLEQLYLWTEVELKIKKGDTHD